MGTGRGWFILALAVGMVVLGGCGSVSTKPLASSPTVGTAVAPPTSPAPSATLATTPPTETPTTVAPLARVGSTIAVTGNSPDAAHVTLVAVMDPVAPGQFSTPSAGTRIVGVEWKIVNSGPSTLSDDANNDAAVIGSNDQTYSAAFDQIPGCTNFDSGDFKLAPSEASTGCVAFEIPTAVKVAKINFGLDDGNGTTGQWQVATAAP